MTEAEKIEKMKQYISESKRIVFFGGAGVSTESGIPDFRSKDGLYNKKDIRFEKYSPEYLLSHSCFENEPEVFFEFYRQKMDSRKALPNRAHLFLARLEEKGKLCGVVTQNIDGLHTKAGSKTVFEIHGTTLRNYCVSCRREYPENYIFDSSEKVPKCPCGGVIRCDVTLYEESLPEKAVSGAVKAISSADMLIIGGTSLTVYPASSYIRYFRGRHLVLINKESLGFPLREGDIEINRPIGEVFAECEDIL